MVLVGTVTGWRVAAVIRGTDSKLSLVDKTNAAMNATTELGRLQIQRESLTYVNFDYGDHLAIDARIAELEEIITAALPDKKDPYLEYGEAEVEMLLS